MENVRKFIGIMRIKNSNIDIEIKITNIEIIPFIDENELKFIIYFDISTDIYSYKDYEIFSNIFSDIDFYDYDYFNCINNKFYGKLKTFKSISNIEHKYLENSYDIEIEIIDEIEEDIEND